MVLIIAELAKAPTLVGSETLAESYRHYERRILMDFRPVKAEERQKLIDALRGNAEDNLAILMDRRDTSFVGSSAEVSDDEVISAIQSVPCHY